jgi:hypothetical protein
MKNGGKVLISSRAATVTERVVTREWHGMKKWVRHALAHARGSVWVDNNMAHRVYA